VEKPIPLPSGKTVSPDYLTVSVYGMSRGAVRWIGDEPELGPETQRTPDHSLRLVEVMRSVNASRPSEIEYRGAAGSAVTFKMPGAVGPRGS
jgi:hypothetical protein